MYLIPIVILVILALIAVAWTPIFALIFFVIFMIGFFVYIGMSRRSDEQITPPQVPGQTTASGDDEDAGLWGERRPPEPQE
jgi:hypothetical protein